MPRASRLIVRPRTTIPKDTACGYTDGPRDERKPDDAPVTCRTCARTAAPATS